MAELALLGWLAVLKGVLALALLVAGGLVVWLVWGLVEGLRARAGPRNREGGGSGRVRGPRRLGASPECLCTRSDCPRTR